MQLLRQPARPLRSLLGILKKPGPISNRHTNGRQLLELPVNDTKQSTSLFLIDNFCAFFALRLLLRSALFAPPNALKEQFS